MMAPPTELTSSATTINSLPVEILAEVMLRVPTPAALVHAAAASTSWRGVIATDEFLARYRRLHKSSPFLGLYIPREVAGPPSFQMPDSIRSAAADARDRDLKGAVLKAFDFDEIRRYQDHRLPGAAVDNAFSLGRLEVHPGCRLLDCHNSRLLLARGSEALEVRSPLACESILVPIPPHAVHPDSLSACLLQGHGDHAASFRVVSVQHRREGHNRQARAVEYDSRRKSWRLHPWDTLNSIEGTPGEVMHAGHRIFCKYTGTTSATLMLDTRKMEFSVLPLPCDNNPKNYAIGEMEDGVCCLASVELVGSSIWHNRRLRLEVWNLQEEKLDWKLEKEMQMDQLLGEHSGYYRVRVITNGIALLCSTTKHRHFVVDLNTFIVKEEFEFNGQIAYPMQMPWPPLFSGATVNAVGGFGRDGGPAPVAVGDARTGAGESDEIEVSSGMLLCSCFGTDHTQRTRIFDDVQIAPSCSKEASAASTAAGGFGLRDAGPAPVRDAWTGAGESDEIELSPGLSLGPSSISSICSVPGTSCRSQEIGPATAPSAVLRSVPVAAVAPAGRDEGLELTVPSGFQLRPTVALTTAGSPSYPQQGESSAEQRGEAARDGTAGKLAAGSRGRKERADPKAVGRGRRHKKPNAKYVGGDWVDPQGLLADSRGSPNSVGRGRRQKNPNAEYYTGDDQIGPQGLLPGSIGSKGSPDAEAVGPVGRQKKPYAKYVVDDWGLLPDSRASKESPRPVVVGRERRHKKPNAKFVGGDWVGQQGLVTYAFVLVLHLKVLKCMGDVKVMKVSVDTNSYVEPAEVKLISYSGRKKLVSS